MLLAGASLDKPLTLISGSGQGLLKRDHALSRSAEERKTNTLDEPGTLNQPVMDPNGLLAWTNDVKVLFVVSDEHKVVLGMLQRDAKVRNLEKAKLRRFTDLEWSRSARACKALLGIAL